MKRLTVVAALLVFAGAASMARADEQPNPTGTWKWTFELGGMPREGTAKLKLEGGKLTGTVAGRMGQEAPIQDAKYDKGHVTFKVVREREGNKITIKYDGKVTGDTIKGQIQFEFQDQSQTIDWEAKRVKS